MLDIQNPTQVAMARGIRAQVRNLNNPRARGVRVTKGGQKQQKGDVFSSEDLRKSHAASKEKKEQKEQTKAAKKAAKAVLKAAKEAASQSKKGKQRGRRKRRASSSDSEGSDERDAAEVIGADQGPTLSSRSTRKRKRVNYAQMAHDEGNEGDEDDAMELDGGDGRDEVDVGMPPAFAPFGFRIVPDSPTAAEIGAGALSGRSILQLWKDGKGGARWFQGTVTNQVVGTADRNRGCNVHVAWDDEGEEGPTSLRAPEYGANKEWVLLVHS